MLRVGDYSGVYAIDEKTETVTVIAIGIRGKIYQTLDRRISTK
jgi:mRNA-degrading endonuclease RelE of RelBE toxin-antitoxin system